MNRRSVRAQSEHLPDPLARTGKIVREPIGFRPEVPMPNQPESELGWRRTPLRWGNPLPGLEDALRFGQLVRDSRDLSFRTVMRGRPITRFHKELRYNEILVHTLITMLD